MSFPHSEKCEESFDTTTDYLTKSACSLIDTSGLVCYSGQCVEVALDH